MCVCVCVCVCAHVLSGFPNEEAAKIALTVTRQWLENDRERV